MNLFDEVCEMTLRVMCVSLSGFEITCENCYINFIVKKAAKIVTKRPIRSHSLLACLFFELQVSLSQLHESCDTLQSNRVTF